MVIQDAAPLALGRWRAHGSGSALGEQRIIYFDNAATSWPKPAEVLEAMVRFTNEVGANPGQSVEEPRRLTQEASLAPLPARTTGEDGPVHTTEVMHDRSMQPEGEAPGSRPPDGDDEGRRLSGQEGS